MPEEKSKTRSAELVELGAELGGLRAGFVGSVATGQRSNLPDLGNHAVTISISTDQARSTKVESGGASGA
jgi:hypothetical protein